MTPTEILRQRIEKELDAGRWHQATVPAREAREAILAALDEPLPVEEPES